MLVTPILKYTPVQAHSIARKHGLIQIQYQQILITTLCAIPLGIPDHIGDFHSESFHLDNFQHFY